MAIRLTNYFDLLPISSSIRPITFRTMIISSIKAPRLKKKNDSKAHLHPPTPALLPPISSTYDDRSVVLPYITSPAHIRINHKKTVDRQDPPHDNPIPWNSDTRNSNVALSLDAQTSPEDAIRPRKGPQLLTEALPPAPVVELSSSRAAKLYSGREVVYSVVIPPTETSEGSSGDVDAWLAADASHDDAAAATAADNAAGSESDAHAGRSSVLHLSHAGHAAQVPVKNGVCARAAHPDCDICTAVCDAVAWELQWAQLLGVHASGIAAGKDDPAPCAPASACPAPTPAVLHPPPECQLSDAEAVAQELRELKQYVSQLRQREHARIEEEARAAALRAAAAAREESAWREAGVVAAGELPMPRARVAAACAHVDAERDAARVARRHLRSVRRQRHAQAAAAEEPASEGSEDDFSDEEPPAPTAVPEQMAPDALPDAVRAHLPLAASAHPLHTLVFAHATRPEAEAALRALLAMYGPEKAPAPADADDADADALPADLSELAAEPGCGWPQLRQLLLQRSEREQLDLPAAPAPASPEGDPAARPPLGPSAASVDIAAAMRESTLGDGAAGLASCVDLLLSEAALVADTDAAAAQRRRALASDCYSLLGVSVDADEDAGASGELQTPRAAGTPGGADSAAELPAAVGAGAFVPGWGRRLSIQRPPQPEESSRPAHRRLHTYQRLSALSHSYSSVTPLAARSGRGKQPYDYEAMYGAGSPYSLCPMPRLRKGDPVATLLIAGKAREQEEQDGDVAAATPAVQPSPPPETANPAVPRAPTEHASGTPTTEPKPALVRTAGTADVSGASGSSDADASPAESTRAFVLDESRDSEWLVANSEATPT